MDGLVEARQAAHQTRTGQPMSEDHVWLTLRRCERRALEVIVDTLRAQPPGQPAPIRGVGASSRIVDDRRDGAESGIDKR